MNSIVLFKGDDIYIGNTHYAGSQVDDIKRSTGYINSDLQAMSSNFCKLGFHLWELKKIFMGRYLADNGKVLERDTCMEFNFYDYVQEIFGISKSSCNNFIRVCLTFCIKDNVSIHMCLDKKYQDYGYSQLVEMAAMPSYLLDSCKPSMTVRQLRQMRIDDKMQYSVDSCDVKVVGQTSGRDVNKPLSKASFKDVYSKKLGCSLEDDILTCLTGNIKNVDKVKALVELLENYWQEFGI